MLNPNRVQKQLLSLGYPVRIVRQAYKKNSRWYREEVRDYGEEKRSKTNRSGRS